MASLLEVSQPTVEPVSLMEANTFLRQPAGQPDAVTINALIPAARRYIESMTGLTLAQRKFVQYEERFPYSIWPFYFQQSRAPTVQQALRDHRVRLLRSPLAAVEKVIYIGVDGALHALLPGTDFIVDYAHRPGHITPLTNQDWPELLPTQLFPEQFWLTESWAPVASGVNRVQIFFTAGFTAAATDFEDIKLGAQWQPATTFPQYFYVFDASGNLQIQMTAPSGRTGNNPITFATLGLVAADNTASWLNGGVPLGNYQTGHAYAGPSIVIDSNGNVEFTASPLTSGGSVPAWPATGSAIGTATPDNGGTWIFLGALQTSGPEPPMQLVEYQADTGIPEDLKTAILLVLSHFYYNREPVVEGREGKVADLLHSLSALCDNHRVWDFGSVAPW